MAFKPFHLIKDTTKFDFIGKRWWGFIISGLLTLISIGLLLYHGLNLGIDFTGGVLMEVRTEREADLAKMRHTLDGHDFGEVSLQNFGDQHTVMIRIQLKEGQDQSTVVAKVKELLGKGVEYRKTDFVGPTVGKELKRSGIIAALLSFASIMLYVWFRFEWQYGVGAILALFHDTIMMIGFFAVSQFEFGLTALAAVLTIIGYSVNDSVVIYDRIRENMRKYKKMPISDLLNQSINETLSRTVLTAGTVFLASLALALFGGEVLRGFSVSLLFGIFVGTYSSIYVSAPVLIYLGLRQSPQEAAATAPANG